MPQQETLKNSAEPVLMTWSGGKDSSLALEATLKDPELHVEALVTTVTDGYERISMHGVRVELLQAQAQAIGVPLELVRIPINCSDETYRARMEEMLTAHRERGVKRCIFGDLFLEDIREYREKNLAEVGMRGIYPIWRRDTAELAREFVAKGFRAVLTTVDPKQLDPSFCGRDFDASLLDDLPSKVDPCGENGEFHTFVHNGPIFSRPVALEKGEVVERDGFWFCDLLPASKDVVASTAGAE